MDDGYGPWRPLELAAAAHLFRPAPFRWWVSGGYALELHLGRSWREHDDTDISFRRSDAPLVRLLLQDWDLHLAAAGVLSRWTGDELDPQAHHNNIWARRAANEPWELDLTVSDGDDANWIYRRDPSLTRDWGAAVLRTPETDIPYLAPELQMLFKSKDIRPKDDLDAEQVLPNLSPPRLEWLGKALPHGHQWLRQLS